MTARDGVMNASSDPTISTPRMLRREHKKSKRLRRWDSLPEAQRFPQNRPLYVCRECKFMNGFGEKCPWCLSICDLARITHKSPMRRRISAPLLLNDIQKDQLQKMEGKGPNRTRTGGAPSSNSSPPPPPPSSSCFGHTKITGTNVHVPAGGASSSIVGSFDLFLSTQAPPNEQRDGRRKRHRNAMAYSINIVEQDTPSSPPSPHSPPPLPPLPSSPPPPASQPQSTAIPLPNDTPPTPLYPICPSEGSTPTFMPRTLRRKPRQAILRERSSCSLRRKALSLSIYDYGHRRHQSTDQPSFISLPQPRPRLAFALAGGEAPAGSTSASSLLSSSSSSAPPNHQRSRSGARSAYDGAQHYQSLSLDLSRNPHQSSFRARHATGGTSTTNTASTTSTSGAGDEGYMQEWEPPLGHPTRPLYTAIRKGMSRPRSPPPALLSFGDGVGGGSGRGGTGGSRRSLNIIPAPSVSPTASGFSLSGEVELRLALAKERREASLSDDDDEELGRWGAYRGSVVSGSVTSVDGRKKGEGSVRGKVKKIGKGLKELVVGWRSSS